MLNIYVVCGIYCGGEKLPSVPTNGVKWRPINKLSLTALEASFLINSIYKIYNFKKSPSKHLLYSVFYGDGVS